MSDQPKRPATPWAIEEHFKPILGDLMGDEPEGLTKDQKMIRDLFLHYTKQEGEADFLRGKLCSIRTHWERWLRLSRESSKHLDSLTYARPEEFDIVSVSFPKNDFEEIEKLVTTLFR